MRTLARRTTTDLNPPGFGPAWYREGPAARPGPPVIYSGSGTRGAGADGGLRGSGGWTMRLVEHRDREGECREPGLSDAPAFIILTGG